MMQSCVDALAVRNKNIVKRLTYAGTYNDKDLSLRLKKVLLSDETKVNSIGLDVREFVNGLKWQALNPLKGLQCIDLMARCRRNCENK